MLFFSLSIFQLGERMVVLKPCRFFMVTSRFWRTLEVNNFVSVDFQTQVSIWFLISMKFCTRIINKKGGVRKCNSAENSAYRVLARPYLMTLYIIFPIHMNFLKKSFIENKKKMDCFMLPEFFWKEIHFLYCTGMFYLIRFSIFIMLSSDISYICFYKDRS